MGRPSSKWYIGIDPGQKGGIVLIDHRPKVTSYCPMPDTVTGMVEEIRSLISVAGEEPADVALITELAQVMPKQGAVSGFTYGRHFGAIEAIAVALGLPYHEVRPGKWKKDMGLNSDKTNSIKLCERLFPGVQLVLPPCRVKHDGIAEAILIAEWGRRNNL